MTFALASWLALGAAHPQALGPGDGDGDGIPDSWERARAPVRWGALSPAPGVPDLLVEFVKVEEPDGSGSLVDLRPAYDMLASFFSGAGIRLSWIETRLQVREEAWPGFLEPADATYVLSLLERSHAAGNPFVASVVLSPDHKQEWHGLTRGASVVGGRLAVVDYGAHTDVLLQPSRPTASWHVELVASPAVENLVVAGAHEDLARLGLHGSGKGVDGSLTATVDAAPHDGYSISWRPGWFGSGVRALRPDGERLDLVRTHMQVRHAELAATIAHELGHLLHLCHAHEPACYSGFPPDQRGTRHASAMSYEADPTSLRFLPIEWERLSAQLACPPSLATTLTQKYGEAFSAASPEPPCAAHAGTACPCRAATTSCLPIRGFCPGPTMDSRTDGL